MKRSTGVPPVSRMGVPPMQTPPDDKTCLLRHDQHGLEARATHGRDAHATLHSIGASAHATEMTYANPLE